LSFKKKALNTEITMVHAFTVILEQPIKCKGIKAHT